VRLEDEVHDRQEDEQEERKEREEEDDGEQAPASESAETSHKMAIFDLPMSVA
jgi:hypothetical protein